MYLNNQCSILEMFAESVNKYTDKAAVIFNGKAITYKELDETSDLLAGYLSKLNISNSLIGICFNKVPGVIAAALAIWKSGNAYVPLDPNYPKQRLEYIVKDAGISLILADNETLNQSMLLGANLCIDIDDCKTADSSFSAKIPESDDSAYAIYTSGSTGNPKGVLISHGAFANFIGSMKKCPGITENDRMLFNTTISFDISTLEMFLPLAAGASIVMSPYSSHNGGEVLASLIDDSDVTVAQGTPSLWQMLIDSGWMGNDAIKILCGGEAISSELAKELLSRCCSLWNMYGPTETTVWSMVSRIESSDDISFGEPIDNTTIYILDDEMKQVRPGESGELYIGGAGLSKGYIGRDDLTAERFLLGIEDPCSAVYKTGDVVKLCDNGKIVYQGRADFQVKLRGHRIELGEIESAIAEHPSVKQAAVVLWDNGRGDKKLAAYYTAKENAQDINNIEFKKLIDSRLPSYMMPGFFCRLESFPLTANGKLDRKALQSIDPSVESVSGVDEEPQTETEKQLAEIWCDVLGIDEVGRNDDFLDLGGHSLLANRLVIVVNRTFGIKLTLLELLTNGMTIAELAELVENKIIANIDETQLSQLMEKIDSLSEEEIKSLLGSDD